MFMTIVQLSLGGLLLLTGGTKLLGIPAATATVTRHGYPRWMARVVGALELAGAGAVVAGLWQPLLAVAGGGLIVAVMLGAIHAHLVRSGEPLVRALPAVLVLTLAAAMLIWNASSLGLPRSGGASRVAPVADAVSYTHWPSPSERGTHPTRDAERHTVQARRPA